MVTTLNVRESGTLTYCKRPGAILENGSLVAKLSLDDPAQCKRAQKYDGDGFEITSEETPSSKIMNLSQGYVHAKTTLDNALSGYCYPDRYFDPIYRPYEYSLLKHSTPLTYIE